MENETQNKTKKEMLEELKNVPLVRHSINHLAARTTEEVAEVYEEAKKLGHIKSQPHKCEDFDFAGKTKTCRDCGKVYVLTEQGVWFEESVLKKQDKTVINYKKIRKLGEFLINLSEGERKGYNDVMIKNNLAMVEYELSHCMKEVE